MKKQKTKIAVIGEGPTEFYYIQSLVDIFRGISIKPDYPKHTSMRELARKISECIDEGYSYVFCIIDMDNKNVATEMSLYQALKKKYENPVSNKRKGIHCEVKFYETHLCTELFFYFYFTYTTRYFDSQPPLISALNQHCHYEKSTEFFRKCKGLHNYFEKNGGSLDTAIHNAEKSLANRETTGNDYTYSEIGNLLTKINSLLQQDT
ncbi:MAG: RloB family protein [Duncaniella sp.]|nr:RloB family protein [Duncaniella sp.]